MNALECCGAVRVYGTWLVRLQHDLLHCAAITQTATHTLSSFNGSQTSECYGIHIHCRGCVRTDSKVSLPLLHISSPSLTR